MRFTWEIKKLKGETFSVEGGVLFIISLGVSRLHDAAQFAAAGSYGRQLFACGVIAIGWLAMAFALLLLCGESS